jgi:hypothetical protein
VSAAKEKVAINIGAPQSKRKAIRPPEMADAEQFRLMASEMTRREAKTPADESARRAESPGQAGCCCGPFRAGSVMSFRSVSRISACCSATLEPRLSISHFS